MALIIFQEGKMDFTFTSKVFETEVITLADTKETIVRGGRDKFPLLVKAFEGIKQIGRATPVG